MIDASWDKIFQTRDWSKYPDLDVVRFMHKHFRGEPNPKTIIVLEVGCATGGNLKYLAQEGYQFFGVDGSQTAIKKARVFLEGFLPHGHFNHLMVGDIGRLQFESDTFDVVIDNEAVYANSADDAREIYKEIRRVLKPGGMLFTKTFAPGTTPTVMASETFYRLSDIQEMRELLAGFEVKNIDMTARTVDNMEALIREWLITARKPDATD